MQAIPNGSRVASNKGPLDKLTGLALKNLRISLVSLINLKQYTSLSLLQ